MKQHFHKFQWYYLIFLGIIFLGLAGYYVIRLGHYPLAIVNGDIVSASHFNEEFAAAYRYYSLSLRGEKNVDLRGREFVREIRRATLNDLLEKALISQELESRVGGELSRLVESKLAAQKIDRRSIEESAKVLYGLTLADFTQLVLVPQAEREILEGRLFLENKKSRFAGNFSGSVKRNRQKFFI
jgi:hypothetical protein